jgi:hypothetical protein
MLGYFGLGYFSLGYFGGLEAAAPSLPPGARDPYDANDNPDFLSALVAYWIITPGLVAISPFPYADEGPDQVEEDASFVVLSQVASRISGRGSKKRAYFQETFYQFAVYHPDQDTAADLGLKMIALLDTIQDRPLAFAAGVQRSWFRAGERLMKVPGVGEGRALTVWQQAHIYRARILRYRGV